ncbi:alpha/beta fold hydrolase [Oceanobacter mangrovi]|uniref:alpha/beta fold hydrolase n=1 Tax=Oceanobacter mangrovi TaxID=2862510 RepID=UPI001C8D61F5|nr:alpha/beta hydrolase [Oceanobacter mangrovi]
MEKHPINVRTEIADQHALLFQCPNNPGGRRLILIHGAGIAGELTWTYVVNYLEGWSEILVPDLAGMGGSRFHGLTQPTAKDYATQMEQLIDKLDWWDADIAGYSFGGTVTVELLKKHSFNLLYLLEPAWLAGDSASHLIEKRQRYAGLSERLASGDESAYLDFLDAVSPNRRSNPTADKIAIKRLKTNEQGLVEALHAVSESLASQQDYYLNWVSDLPGLSMVGENSSPDMYVRQQRLEQESPDWIAQQIAGADHSLVFTHPKQVARLMNERLKLLLADLGE